MAWTRNANYYNQLHTPEAKARRTCDGILFGSLPEMSRYRDYLKPLLKAGHIIDLEFQPRFYLDVFDFRLGFYTADFQYKTTSGQLIVEEIKEVLEERDFPVRWKLVQVLYPTHRFVYLKASKRGIKYQFDIKKKEPKALKTPPIKAGKLG